MTDSSSPVSERRNEPDEQRRGDAEELARLARAHLWNATDATNQPMNALDEHHAFDADVDDAGALVQDAAQRAQGERRGERHDDRAVRDDDGAR